MSDEHHGGRGGAHAMQSTPSRDALRRLMFKQPTPRQQAHFERLRGPRSPPGGVAA